MTNNWKLDGEWGKEKEVVLITGGASGIGELMARGFAKENGVVVVVFDLKEPVEPFPPNIHYHHCDVTSSSSISLAAAAIRKEHGDPTVLINNAGVAACRTILDESEEMIRKTLEVNVVAHFLMVKEFLPKMIEKNHGHVVEIASLGSFVTVAQLVDYCCTKAATMAFHEGLSAELKARYKAPHVRTTIVHPSWIRTPLISELYKSPKWKEAMLEPEDVALEVVKQVLSGRSGTLVIPKEGSWVRGLRAYPDWYQIVGRSGYAMVMDVL
ncbi:hypothetical protein G7Y89_g7499 [Cudoniella acicularis]|uniref:Short-chain dehydrogenase/reductase 3 n=1 Tax=Cudoniella acicularis TaxID=354080 RepID=A0A8H4W206_9HELO|nr:hypothetical protein G7Y89_g7499 [Cudoniella acicularis]